MRFLSCCLCSSRHKLLHQTLSHCLCFHFIYFFFFFWFFLQLFAVLKEGENTLFKKYFPLINTDDDQITSHTDKRLRETSPRNVNILLAGARGAAIVLLCNCQRTDVCSRFHLNRRGPARRAAATGRRNTVLPVVWPGRASRVLITRWSLFIFFSVESPTDLGLLLFFVIFRDFFSVREVANFSLFFP